jgi:RecB family endonuclease NucS
MDARYSDWLRRVVPTEATWRTKLSELRRVEAAYGDLDAAFDEDELESILSELTYSSVDARNNEPNPSKLEIGGDIRNNLASYKSAVNKYATLRREIETSTPIEVSDRQIEDDIAETARFSMERDLQAALRAEIGQLETGLQVADGGIERSVASGRIDILARDGSGAAVVIELKSVLAPAQTLGQIAAYMGDLTEAGEAQVRGIIVAPEFHPKLVSACRVVPAIRLVRYAFRFAFETVA